MPYVKNYPQYEDVNFLASGDVNSMTYQIDDAGVVADSEGRKIVPAGSVYPANDETAIGITYTPTDVTHGPTPGAVLIRAWILEERLPVAPSTAAKAALASNSLIRFKQSVQ